MARFPTTVSVLKFITSIAVLVLLQAPMLVHAEEPLQLLFVIEKENLSSFGMPEGAKKGPERRLFLEVDEHGDVVMRRGNMSVIMAYNSVDDAQRSQERTRDIQPSQAPLLSGFCIKVSFLF